MMIKIIRNFMMFGLIFLSFFAAAERAKKEYGGLGIPYELKKESSELSISIKEDKITIVATKGTDLYTNSDGTKSIDNAPRLFFEPKADFSFSAKIAAKFSSPYDGGALYVYADKDSWGKFLFERFKAGDNGIASTVSRAAGDDAYHYLIENDEVYLKITRTSNKYTFFYSNDGERWSYIRSFSLISEKAVKVGFIAQSPISQNHKVIYSDIVFKE